MHQRGDEREVRSAGMTRSMRLGPRICNAGWVALVLFATLELFIVDEVAYAFRDGPIELRSWMVSYNGVVASCQLVVLGLLAVGAAIVRNTKSVWPRRAALICLAGAMASALAMLLSAWILDPGPWAADSAEIAALRLMVFSPVVLRSLGCGLLIVHLMRSELVPRRRALVAVAAVALDFGLVTVTWLGTPIAVFATIHPSVSQPLQMVPFFAAAAFALVLARQDP